MTDTKLVLYSTWGCHLCEDAQSLLTQQQLSFTVLDIVDDPAAFAKFRTSIPVLAAGSFYLYWPFDETSLRAFINEPSLQGK
jgi:glutaredoxin